MKRFTHITVISIIVSTAIALASCNGNGAKNRFGDVAAAMSSLDSKALTAGPIVSSAPYVVVPAAIGVSKLIIAPYPDYDGGSDCFNIQFTIAVKLKGESASHTVPVNFTSCKKKADSTKSELKVLKGKRLHAILSSVNPKKITVTIVGDDVTKIVHSEKWKGRLFLPGEVLWQEKE